MFLLWKMLGLNKEKHVSKMWCGAFKKKPGWGSILFNILFYLQENMYPNKGLIPVHKSTGKEKVVVKVFMVWHSTDVIVHLLSL